MENPETTLSVVNPPPGVFGFNTSPNATLPSSQIVVNSTPGANGVSTDIAPDLVGKVALDPGWGHYEIKGLFRFFRDRIDGHNNTESGGGAGFGAIVPLTKKIDLVAEGLIGSGIGRYGSGQMPDVTLAPDGAVEPIGAWHLLAGLEAHPAPKLDLYAYFGREHSSQRAFVNAAGEGVGYGSPLNDNSACAVQVSAAGALCQAHAQDLRQVQPGSGIAFTRDRKGCCRPGCRIPTRGRTHGPGQAVSRPAAACTS